MRIQIILLLIAFAANAFAVDDKSINELFKKYDLVMDQKKIELIDEVFSQKFIKESGGKEELISKIKGLPEQLVSPKTNITWKKGKGNIILARMKEVSSDKRKTHQATEFIVVMEDSKPKIDGTLSDAE